tara:strand:- start:63 stop:299 length:237 start_codon:yes stop_codon:yes gene_type:complete
VGRFTLCPGVTETAGNVATKASVNANTETEPKWRYAIRHSSMWVKVLGIGAEKRFFQIGRHQIYYNAFALVYTGAIWQ